MAKKIDKDNPGRNFEVLIPQLGIWRQNQVFSEYQFRQLHPAPKPTFHQEAADVEPAEAYWDRMLTLLTDARPGDGVNIPDRKPFIRVVVDRQANVLDSADIMAANPKPQVNPMIVEAVRMQRELAGAAAGK